MEAGVTTFLVFAIIAGAFAGGTLIANQMLGAKRRGS